MDQGHQAVVDTSLGPLLHIIFAFSILYFCLLSCQSQIKHKYKSKSNIYKLLLMDCNLNDFVKELKRCSASTAGAKPGKQFNSRQLLSPNLLTSIHICLATLCCCCWWWWWWWWWWRWWWWFKNMLYLLKTLIMSFSVLGSKLLSPPQDKSDSKYTDWCYSRSISAHPLV